MYIWNQWICFFIVIHMIPADLKCYPMVIITINAVDLQTNCFQFQQLSITQHYLLAVFMSDDSGKNLDVHRYSDIQ